MTRRIILLASHRAQALDITGPAAVFSAANDLFTDAAPYSVEIVSPDGGLISSISCVSIDSVSLANTPVKGVDTVLVTGHDAKGTRAFIQNDAAKAWMKHATQSARRWGSVCSGAFMLAAWGLLTGKKVATHWQGEDELEARYRDVCVDKNALFVKDGNTWTSAGVTAGIDMALAMVEDDLGADVATDIARRLVVYLRRPGSQSQFSSPLKCQGNGASPYHELIQWAQDNLDKALTVQALADHAGQSVRTFQRRFSQQVGRTPAAFIEDLRLERAKALIAHNSSLQHVSKNVGYPSAAQLSIAFKRKYGVAPSVWKAMHCG